MEDMKNKNKDEEDVSILHEDACIHPLPRFLRCDTNCLRAAAERRADGPEEALHPGGNGSGADGTQSIQREADGAAGGCEVDRDDQVRTTKL